MSQAMTKQSNISGFNQHHRVANVTVPPPSASSNSIWWAWVARLLARLIFYRDCHANSLDKKSDILYLMASVGLGSVLNVLTLHCWIEIRGDTNIFGQDVVKMTTFYCLPLTKSALKILNSIIATHTITSVFINCVVWNEILFFNIMMRLYKIINFFLCSNFFISRPALCSLSWWPWLAWAGAKTSMTLCTLAPSTGPRTPCPETSSSWTRRRSTSRTSPTTARPLMSTSGLTVSSFPTSPGHLSLVNTSRLSLVK